MKYLNILKLFDAFASAKFPMKFENLSQIHTYILSRCVLAAFNELC